jgi:CBS domain-containing protein
MGTKFDEYTVMRAKRLELYSCRPDTALGDAADQMVSQDISCLVVVDADGYLVGVISRRDFLPTVLTWPNWRERSVASCMSHYVVTVTQDTTLSEVTARLLEHHIHRVVVTDGKPGRPRPVAVVSDSDLLYHMVHHG